MKTFTEAYEFLLSVIGGVPYGVVAVDMDGFITMINENALENMLITFPINKVLETNILDYVGEIEMLENTLRQCFKKGRKEFEINEIPYADKYLNFNGKPILNGMLLSINDITETKKAQVEATLSLLKGQEMERRRLATEIHDGIGPLMSTIRLNLDAVKNDMKEATEKTLKKMNNMSELVQNVSTDIRSISHALMPSALVDFGLTRALQNLCTKATQSEMVEVDFYHKGFEKRLDRVLELNLFRVAQELLNNSLKYSQSKSIHIQLIRRKGKIVLTVEDEGVGFDPKLIDEKIDKGIGLKNVQTRVNSLGGLFSIETQVGKGVHSTVEIPV